MNILFFIESLQAGGKERRVIELIKSLIHYDIKIEIVLLNRDIHYSEIFDLGVNIHYLKRKKTIQDFSIFLKFLFLVRKVKPDLIHVWGNVSAFYAIPAKIILQKILVNSQITDAPQRFTPGFRHKMNFRLANVIISNSKAGLKSYNSPENKSIVINNGFNFNRIGKMSVENNIKKELTLTTPYIIGMVATFYQLKDYTTYILAALDILTEREDVSFLCVGAGDSSKYQKMVPEHLKQKILFPGKRNDVESIMSVCNIGVLSTFTEGIPNTVMEYMALAKPIVATNGGGVSELVIDKETGFLIPEQDKKAMKDKILELLDNPELAKKMGVAGKNRIQTEFGIEKMVKSYYSIYEKLCAE
jgi:glycosyltransferase involved in cell wall biosynthesis